MPDAGELLTREKLLKRARGQPWWVLVLIATLPPLVTAFFSYRASVVEAKINAAEAKRTAEAGYDALVRAVDLLQKHDGESVKAIAQLNGHIDSIEAWMRGMRPHTDRSADGVRLDLPVPRTASNPMSWRPNFPPRVVTPSPPAASAMALPRSLDEAAKK